MAPTKEAADRVRSQLSVLQRSEISNPPSHGARIVGDVQLRDNQLLTKYTQQVSLILNDETLFEEWKRDIKTMAERIIDMRFKLRRLLEEKKYNKPRKWEHITNQIGMFRYFGHSDAV